MNHKTNPPGTEASPAAGATRVFVACEDPTHGQAACARLEGPGSGSETARRICSWWSFEALAISALRNLAAREAVEADVLVVAAKDGPGLPERVGDSISQWLAAQECHPRALVAMLDADSNSRGVAPGLLAQLKGLAEAGGVEFSELRPREGCQHGP